MPSAIDTAITRRFLGFINEILVVRPSAQSLHVLVLRPKNPTPNVGKTVAAVFFAPGIKGVAVASWKRRREPTGAALPKALLRVFEESPKNFREVTARDEIHSILTVLYAALEAQLRGKPKVALMLASATSGAAFELAAAAVAIARLPASGNPCLANYLATFPVYQRELEDPKSDAAAAVPVPDTPSASLLQERQERVQDLPDPVFFLSETEQTRRCRIGVDVCTIDDSRFFVRGLLPLPVHNTNLPYRMSLWAEVDRTTFRKLDSPDDLDSTNGPPISGILANEVSLAPEASGLAVAIYPTGPDTCPEFFLKEVKHCLWEEQSRGVTAQRALKYTRVASGLIDRDQSSLFV